MSEIEKLKKILQVSFGGSALSAVESQVKVINDLKLAVGLPQNASLFELKERISALQAEHEALREQAAKRKTISRKEGKGMAEKTKAGEGTAGAKAVEKWYQKGKCIVGLITAVGILIFGTLSIILYGLQLNTWALGAAIFGVIVILASVFFTFGCLQEKAEEGTAGTKTVEKWYQKGKCVIGLITAVGILIIGTLWIVLYSLQASKFYVGASIFGVAALLGGGFFTTGCLLGFLFGIPKQSAEGIVKTPSTPKPEPQPEPEPEPKPNPEPEPEPETPKPETPQPGTSQTGTPTISGFQVNTNLEQVSDWLTKIVVGVGLTQFNSIPGWLKKYANFLKPNLGNFANAEAFAVGLLIYYLTFGFLSGYLLTRLYLREELEESELHPQGK